MTHRTTQIVASVAIVLVAYWSYALVAVPWIEPPPPKPSPLDPTRGGVAAMPQPNDLDVLFTPDEWERQNPKIINNDGQSLLLWKNYQNQGNGWVDLSPLTIILMPDETAIDDVERMRHAVVMQVPEGANLRFDRPLDLNKGGIGKLIEGHLRGPVRIRSKGKRPDHQDDLLVTTHDVDLSEQRITTPNDVDFQWGQSSGRGRQLEIKLLPRLGPHVADQEGPNIGGIEQIQVEHIEYLYLDMGSASAATAQGPAQQPPAAAPMLGSLASHPAPVKITCRGPFCFRLTEQEPVATFRDQVDVLRIQPDGPSDHMSCELLSIFFTRSSPPPGAAAPAKKTAPGSDLKPSRMVAEGTPTMVDSPMQHLHVKAEQLQCNLKDGVITQIYLEDSQEVLLHKEVNEIHAPSLRYTPGPADHPGQFQLLAAGPGWLRGEMENRPGQQLEARWREKLEARPQDQNEVISLLGGATLKFQAMGQLDARDIHFWMHETPIKQGAGSKEQGAGRGVASLTSPTGRGAGGEGLQPNRSSYQPDRLLAEGNVVGDSQKFAIKQVDRLEVWFSKVPPRPPAPVAAAGSPAPYVPSTGGGPALSPGPTEMPPPAVVQGPSASRLPPLGSPDPTAAGDRTSHMEISGRLLQAHVLLWDQPPGDPARPSSGPALPNSDPTQQQGELAELTVIDNVKLQETQTAKPDDQPLLVTGQRLHATEASTPQAKVTVTGQPAHVEGHGINLTGANIDIDRGANTLAMEGPGQMEKLLDHDLENRPLSQPEPVKIVWQKGMLFDGRKAHFHDAVNVIGNSKLLKTGWLDVYFLKPISLTNTGPQEASSVERLICGDGVFIENRTLDAGQPFAYDRMWLKNLDFNNITGDFHGDGPGRLIRVHRGDPGLNMPGGPPGGLAGPAMARPVALGPQQPPPPNPNQLTCEDLQFNRSLTGNRLSKDLVFHGQVHAAHAPAQSWMTTLESLDPRQLGQQAMVMHCDNLAVNDMSPVAGSAGGNLELIASDNVKAEGTNEETNFNTTSAKLKYAQAKAVLTLEGDGRSLAEFFKQDGPPGTYVEHFAAQTIHYYLKTRQVQTSGVDSLETNQVPGGTPNKK